MQDESQRYARFERLKFDRPHPQVLRITMTSPIKLNAMDELLHREVSQVWPEVEADPSVRAVILTGADGTFSAGGDLRFEQRLQHELRLRSQSLKESREIVLGMVQCSKPIISAVQGWAVGGGLACAVMADISIVSRTARISDGHTKIGVAAGDHAAIIWPLLCGMARAKYYLLTCDRLDGAEAANIGLFSMAVDNAEVQARALEVAVRLAEGAQSAIRWTKRTLNLWLKQSEAIFEASLAYEFLGIGGPENQEGVAAFLDKRKPEFPGDLPV